MSEPPAEKLALNIVDPRVLPAGEDGSGAGRKTLVDRVMGRGAAGTVGKLSDAKERYALVVALIITWTFAFSAILILVGLYAILSHHSPDAEALLVKAGVPALKEVGTFLSSVFGPLLAFVLGYYFGERKSKEA
jgi:MFS family permease